VEIATEDRVERSVLEDFVRPRRNVVLLTTRRDGRPQASPVTGALGADGHLLVASYPTRAKVRNLVREPVCSAMVLSDDFGGAWVQVHGTAAVHTGEAGVERLVDYFRAAAGDHPDWDEYRQAMRDRDKVAIDITITGWGPIATGGVPPEFADDDA
jgi:PPOX class probable F420-dependent enzyme